ncbi:MAG TPA: SufD family Fe-S cluster assembly protein [Acidimicrobiales bacterium]|nr:SufD family Fe-S cluster assembly protein [Acidimicrobiales bacterium]
MTATTTPGSWSTSRRTSPPGVPLPSFSPQTAAALAGPQFLATDRRAAAERFAAAALPTSTLEEWRYSRIDALDPERYQPLTAPSTPEPDRGQLGRLLAALGPAVTVIETTDGWVSGSSGSDPAVTVGRVSDLDDRPAGFGDLAGEPDAFATASRAFAPDPVVIRVQPHAAAAPVVVVHWCAADDAALFPRILIQASEDSEVSVLEVVAGPGRSLVAPVTEIDVARAARVSYLNLQTLAPAAWQIGLQASRVGADASFTSAAVALGGDYARLRTDSALTGPGGSTRMLALYFGAGQQMHDFRTVQDHRAPKTHSDLLYKGVVANTARSVYSGLIRVEKGARGTNAFQTNRNLVLHEGAHADSVPNLEIEDNDVRCSHASAVGPVSEDQRFYLESRGVPPEVTDRLISLGFLHEVVERLPFPALAPLVTEALRAKLRAAEAAEAEREVDS